MSVINAIIKFVMDIGGGVFLPFTILILGIIFKQKPFEALKNGLRVGAGFLGINVILNMLISGLQPAIDYYGQFGNGAGFTIVDIGWEGMSTIAWSTSFSLLIVPLGMILNYILIKARFTKTMDIDVWNYFHMIFGASMLYYVLTLAGMGKVLAYILAVVFGLATCVVVLMFADKTAKKWQDYYNLPGTACCNHDMIYLWGISWFTCKVLNTIPGVKNIKINVEWFADKLGAFGESSVLTFFVGLLLSVLTHQSLAGALTLAVTLSAAIIIMPKVVSLLMEGLTPVSKDARKFFHNKLGDGYDINIGMDEALCLGDETGIQLVGIMIPITILIAFLPGVHMFPLSTLGSMIYITCGAAMYADGDVFKTLISSILIVIYKTYVNTWMAPIATEMAYNAGTITSTATLVSGSTTAETNALVCGLLGKLLKVW